MTDILIGYIDDFKFSNPALAAKLAPHPKQGSIYRIIRFYPNNANPKEIITPVYQIYIGRDNNEAKMDTMFLGHTLEGEYFNKWTFSIIPVTKTNVTDFDIKPEELPSLATWLETDHADLKGLIEKSPMPVDMNISTGETTFAQPELPHPLEQEFMRLKNAEEYYTESLEAMSEALTHIIRTDREFSMVLSDLMRYLASTYSDKYEDSGRANMSRDFLMTSDSPEVALFNSMKYIQRYTTKGFEKSGNTRDILKAIHYCLFELQRAKSKINND